MSDYECHSLSLIEELVVEILIKLPLKSVLKCTSVCKSWYFLIKTRKFVASHINQQMIKAYTSNGPRHLLYNDVTNDIITEKYVVLIDNNDFDLHKEFNFSPKKGFSIVGCCDGIFCYADYNGEPDELVLWNPSLGKHLNLFSPRQILDEEHYFCGVGFDSVACEYKVILGVYKLEKTTMVVDVFVYSINGGTWKRVSLNYKLGDGTCLVSREFAHLNGAIYWLVKRRYENGDDHLDSILKFSLVTEKFTQIRLPKIKDEELDDYEDHWRLVEGSSENGVANVLDYSSGFLKYWVMEDMDCWKKALSFGTFDNRYRRLVNPRWNGELILQMDDQGCVSVDPKTKAAKHVSDKNLMYIGPYIESLVRL